MDIQIMHLLESEKRTNKQEVGQNVKVSVRSRIRCFRTFF